MLDATPADPRPEPDRPDEEADRRPPPADERPPQPDPRPPQPDASRAAGGRLRRNPQDQVIAGVASGLARYMGVDPVLVRLAFALLTLAGGAGILLYLVLALVMPRGRPTDQDPPVPAARARSLSRVVGWVLIAAGAVFLVGRFVPELEQLVWPVALLGLGVAVLVQGGRS